MNDTKRHMTKRRIMARSYAAMSGEERIARACSLYKIHDVNRDWLLKMKKDAGRPKDLLDIENLS